MTTLPPPLLLLGLLLGRLRLGLLLLLPPRKEIPDFPHHVCVLVDVPLIGVRQPQVEPSAVVEFTPDAELSPDPERRKGNGYATHLLRIAVLIVEIGDDSGFAALLPFVDRILSLLVRLGLPRPHVVLLLGRVVATFLDFLEVLLPLPPRSPAIFQDLLLLLPLLVESVSAAPPGLPAVEHSVQGRAAAAADAAVGDGRRRGRGRGEGERSGGGRRRYGGGEGGRRQGLLGRGRHDLESDRVVAAERNGIDGGECNLEA
mmetsp:Transcript_4928/g.14053  ORF Transcript_4928/g.14053 Transcript_4928/m.14053 type:complete len:259 (+) Transcript_4928:590-1366(+)